MGLYMDGPIYEGAYIHGRHFGLNEDWSCQVPGSDELSYIYF